MYVYYLAYIKKLARSSERGGQLPFNQVSGAVNPLLFMALYVFRFLTDSKDFFFASIYISVQWRFPSRDIDGKDDGRHDGGYNCVLCHQGGMKWRKKCWESNQDIAETRFLNAKNKRESPLILSNVILKKNISLNWCYMKLFHSRLNIKKRRCLRCPSTARISGITCAAFIELI